MTTYQDATINLVRTALKEDIGPGDVTSLACLEPNQFKGLIVAKSDGILSGQVPTMIAFELVDSANRVKFAKQDGDSFLNGDVIACIEGFNQTILTAERTALNFLGHLSGIATMTGKYVKAIKGTACKIIDTRKTTPGWRHLEKQSVIHGGGENHRQGLYDMVLIKDNHIASAGSITAAVERTREYLFSPEFRMQFKRSTSQIEIEVEITNEDELLEAINSGVKRILLDNQTPASLTTLVKIAREIDGQVKLEASGNINLDNVAEMAATGVDYISIGRITHSAPTADFSLRASE